MLQSSKITHNAVSMSRSVAPSACVAAEAATAGCGCEARPLAGDNPLLAAAEATPVHVEHTKSQVVLCHFDVL